MNGQDVEVSADDLELLTELGRGAYGVVEKMRHRPSDTIMAVKVIEIILYSLRKYLWEVLSSRRGDLLGSEISVCCIKIDL